MPRAIRVEFPGAVYHVMARGNERREIFRDDRDRRRFLDALAVKAVAYSGRRPTNRRCIISVAIQLRNGVATNNPTVRFPPPLIAGDQLIICDTGGNCRCLVAASGQELWRVRVDAPIVGPPIVWGGRLFFGDFHGKVYAFAG